MFCIEVYDEGKWEELSTTLILSKKELINEVKDLNLMTKEVARLLPVKEKYRIKSLV